jgi:hypothetical protein
MDNTLEDYKKEVNENKMTFKNSAPFAVEKGQETDNARAIEKLNDVKMQCIELRQKEEEMKPGLDIFGYDA